MMNTIAGIELIRVWMMGLSWQIANVRATTGAADRL